MRVITNTDSFTKKMNNIVNYSLGFIEGIQNGKIIFLNNLGQETIEVLKKYIDTNARMNPRLLHHVYEWYRVGSPSARLFDIQYTISNVGLSFNSTFSQSQSIANGATEPFYNKASIMETGQTITIKPKNSKVLAFEIDGEPVFTQNSVTINNPGGNIQGEFERVFDSFFNNYFKQSFLNASGIFQYLENPVVYKKNLSKGARMGKNVGYQTGYRWIANAGIGGING